MKTLILLAIFTLSFNLHAKDETCSKNGVDLIGHYGNKIAPLLTLWSEASGNLNYINVESKDKFSKVKFVFKKNEDSSGLDTSEFYLVKNSTDRFSLIKIIGFLKTRPDKMIVEIYKANKFICNEDVIIVEKDGQDGVLKKL
jgi:hypothetical protein